MDFQSNYFHSTISEKEVLHFCFSHFHQKVTEKYFFISFIIGENKGTFAEKKKSFILSFILPVNQSYLKLGCKNSYEDIYKNVEDLAIICCKPKR